MDATCTSRLRRMIAVAAVVAIPSAVFASCSSSPSARTAQAASRPRASVAPSTTAATAPPTTEAPTTTTVTIPPAPAPSDVMVAPAAPAAVPGCFADLALQVGWPAEAVPHLTYIIERESHCDPSSNTGYRPSTGDWSLGLLQINTLGSLLEARQAACGIGAREELLDPATNLRCGLALYEQSGFGPWGG